MKIVFYNNGNKYMGAIKPTSYKLQCLELRSWIISGNYIVYKGATINNIADIYTIYK